MAALAVPAAAAPRAELRVDLTSATPRTSSAFGLHVRFHPADGGDGKPSPVRGVTVTGPAGFAIDSAAAPTCRASDDELRLLGPSACPAGSQVGAGSYTAMTGFGAPVDPFTGDNRVFNARGSLIEVITVPGTPVSPGFDRLTVDGPTLTAHPPVTPGGPPDGETATRSVDFDIPARTAAGHRLISTPRSCPASGRWRFTGAFAFADGARETVVALVPCLRRTGAPSRRAGRGAPRRPSTASRGRSSGRRCRRARASARRRAARPRPPARPPAQRR